MPTLHLQVCAGFANRVRALVSGLCVAEDLGLSLVIHWFPLSPECVCRFQTVLDPESLPKTVKIVTEELFQALDVQSRDIWDFVYRRWDRQSDISIKSHGIFYTNDNWTEHLRHLKPTRLVKEFLDRRLSQVPFDQAIGVHIRRTDHTKSIEHSPLEGFLQKMRSNKDAFYIVATDDSKVKEQIMVEMGDRCIFPATTLSRRTEEGMLHGVADFFALAKCSVIWGSYASSFSEISSRYGNSELIIVS